MKILKKTNLSIIAIVAFVAFAAFNVYYNLQETDTSLDISLKNIEALANDGEDNDYKCILNHPSCYYTISTQYQLDLFVKKFPGRIGISIGKSIDLTDETQVYTLYKDLSILIRWRYSPVRCGTDRTCYDVVHGAGLI
jgi:hypothetical protein